MKPIWKILTAIATAAAVAFVVYLFVRKDKAADDHLDLASVPMQVVDDMFAVQTKNGVVVMRIEADKMLRYENDTTTMELFPEGFAVYSYTDEGLLETILLSDQARHLTYKANNGEEWQAFGNVSVQNLIKRETMETDTIYWDQRVHQIYTDCYIRMYSPDGFMQGYGMRSDDKARNAVIHKPFNSYSVVVQDTTAILVDSVNFIGPFLKK
ncbi:MAG: LPS export ABC transporter periplasmic protein LptC [Bacteroidales bacterium]|nr:LPS export ABC transporter periplasmic protein LptC [Bacteroidales bacterium]